MIFIINGAKQLQGAFIRTDLSEWKIENGKWKVEKLFKTHLFTDSLIHLNQLQCY